MNRSPAWKPSEPLRWAQFKWPLTNLLMFEAAALRPADLTARMSRCSLAPIKPRSQVGVSRRACAIAMASSPLEHPMSGEAPKPDRSFGGFYPGSTLESKQIQEFEGVGKLKSCYR
ncbi:hypothetical protein EMPG_14641 [Blastomyces silverae]|uniref:Uncharacterized protein n=1 Tax=Blastomyces silverae TaxID=2060906 RepID=A0A0H1BF13_9EURO|nr:hypothetical protein EMPG_14641 [Blastomyces silverae]